jgi:cold shock CspA family protein
MTVEVGNGRQETTLTRERATSWQRGKSNGWCKSAGLGSSRLTMGGIFFHRSGVEGTIFEELREGFGSHSRNEKGQKGPRAVHASRRAAQLS